MKYTTKLFCLVVTLTSAKAASIGGGLSFDRNSASVAGSLVFPRIPGINAPLSSIFPSRQTTTRRPSNGSSSSGSPLSNVLDLFDIPEARSLIPDLSSAANSAGITIPSIAGLPDLSTLVQLPGLSPAIQAARNHVQAALNVTNDISSGIEEALAEAFDSNDPTAAVRTIIETIINAYVTVAANCPLLIVGSRVLQEGIRLALEVARAATNIIFGTTTPSG